MKFIDKQSEPLELKAYKAKANDDWQPTYKDLSKKAKSSIVRALMQEQGDLCCYCEGRITSEHSHIEHFRPQSDTAVDPLEYSNLLRSCLNETHKGDPLHCGKLKDNWFDPSLLISPLDPGCENRFAYSGDGMIRPARKEDHAATETIARLGLGIGKIREQRSQAIEPFLEESLSNEELKTFVSGYLQKNNAGQFGEFHTTVKFLFGEILATRN